MRSISSEEQELIDRAAALLPGGSVGNVYTDIIVRRGEGARVWDVSGNEYIDYLLGSGPMLLGHAHAEVVAAVTEQLSQGSTFFVTHELAIELAQRIVEAVPGAEQVRYTSTGTEATAYALRAVRAFRQRDRILKFEGGYHGMNDYALMSLTPKEPGEFPRPSRSSAGIPGCLEHEVLVAPFNDLERTASIIEQHHDELAGVIMEPFQRVIPPRPGFLEEVREITRRFDIPLIFDEIVTGFRFAYGGAQEYYGVAADLCTLGKVVAGGLPLAAVAGRGDIMECFDPAKARDRFMPQIGTLNGNPIACAAGLATLDVLKREGTYRRIFETGRRLMTALASELSALQLPAQVVGEPPVFDVIFTDEEIVDYRSTLSGDTKLLAKFNQLLREQGIFRGDTKFYVSLAHSAEDVDQTIVVFKDVIARLR